MYTISGTMGHHHRMDFDAILNHIGQCGKWQWRNFFLLWLTREEENSLNIITSALSLKDTSG